MNQNKLDNLLNLIKNESVNTTAIDLKTKRLIYNTPKYYITPKASFVTALALLALVSILGSYNLYNRQQQIAFTQMEQERSEVLGSEYMYTTLISSYQSMLEE